MSQWLLVLVLDVVKLFAWTTVSAHAGVTETRLRMTKDAGWAGSDLLRRASPLKSSNLAFHQESEREGEPHASPCTIDVDRLRRLAGKRTTLVSRQVRAY